MLLFNPMSGRCLLVPLHVGGSVSRLCGMVTRIQDRDDCANNVTQFRQEIML